MAMSKATKKKLDYLISIGLDIDDTASVQKINNWYQKVEVLQSAFGFLGKQIPKSFDKKTLDDFWDYALKKLNEFGKAQATTFESIKKGIIDVQKAVSDAAFARGSIDKNGVSPFTVEKSRAGNEASVYKDLDVGETIEKQTEAYTNVVEGLGDDVQKTILKFGIQKAIKESNSEIAKFLQDNIDDIEKYVTKMRVAYNADGKAVASWVDLKIGEYQKLSVSQEYLEDGLDTKNLGSIDYTAGVRTSQDVTTNLEAALKDLTKAYEEQYSLEKKITDETTKGNVQQVEAYKEQKKLIDDIVESKKKAYLNLTTSDKNGNRTNGQEQIKIIENEISARRRLDEAIRQDTNTRKEQDNTVKTIESTLKQYLSTLESTRKIESSGSDAYGATLQYNEQKLEELSNTLSTYGQNLVTIDAKTGEAVADQTALTNAFGQNQAAIDKVNQAVKTYNDTLSKQKAQQLDVVDTQKIGAAIQKLKELTEARKNLINMQSKGSDSSDIDKVTQRIKELESELQEFTNEVVTNGKRVEETKEYTDAYKKALIDLQNAQEKATNGAKGHTSVLGKLFGNIGQVVSNVVKYNVAQIGLNETIDKTINTMKELDAQLTNIRLVTGESEASAREMLNTYSDMAKELGTTTTEVAEGKFLLSLNLLNCGKLLRD